MESTWSCRLASMASCRSGSWVNYKNQRHPNNANSPPLTSFIIQNERNKIQSQSSRLSAHGNPKAQTLAFASVVFTHSHNKALKSFKSDTSEPELTLSLRQSKRCMCTTEDRVEVGWGGQWGLSYHTRSNLETDSKCLNRVNKSTKTNKRTGL